MGLTWSLGFRVQRSRPEAHVPCGGPLGSPGIQHEQKRGSCPSNQRPDEAQGKTSPLSPAGFSSLHHEFLVSPATRSAKAFPDMEMLQVLYMMLSPQQAMPAQAPATDYTSAATAGLSS